MAGLRRMRSILLAAAFPGLGIGFAPTVGGILAGFVYPRVTGEKTGAQ